MGYNVMCTYKYVHTYSVYTGQLIVIIQKQNRNRTSKLATNKKKNKNLKKKISLSKNITYFRIPLFH